MTRKIIVIILLIAIVFLLCGCDSSLDNTKAYIKINEEIIIIDVDAYTNGSNGSITIRGIDGKIYKTHLINVVLVRDVERR